ncbi:hypothetical protein [Sporomusa acidovorans]|uniref:Uncharacterized protein n=1 Tax=Sporomusa acidovorans (strain ATCC 49682 / DSM 3132 / Mol) TaxID=1123286 RepID=A0ABZ3J8Q2_SPOA4|nr:hypothetical protein [Sporomusa acidovorans]OZC16715.1 hypothetical protein SPACI_41860 [Sporomusa acidovorans DSM 3132]SDE04980.1 hypothetical protein SAMN04488499_100736 [Sporomusa acidovorans]
MQKSYKTTEKWWLGLTILFYVLYNLPGVPVYGDANAALWHGALTVLPLWVVVYGGLFILNKQRRLKKKPDLSPQAINRIPREPVSKGGI